MSNLTSINFSKYRGLSNNLLSINENRFKSILKDFKVDIRKTVKNDASKIINKDDIINYAVINDDIMVYALPDEYYLISKKENSNKYIYFLIDGFDGIIDYLTSK